MKTREEIQAEIKAMDIKLFGRVLTPGCRVQLQDAAAATALAAEAAAEASEEPEQC